MKSHVGISISSSVFCEHAPFFVCECFSFCLWITTAAHSLIPKFENSWIVPLFFCFVLRCVSSQLTHSKGRRWGQKFGRNFSFCTLLATKTRRLLIAIKSTAAARVFSSLILCCSSTSHYASTHEILRLWKMRVFKTTATPPPSTPRPLTQAHFIIIGRVRSVLYGSCENSCAHIKHIVSIRTLFHHPMHSLWVLEFN